MTTERYVRMVVGAFVMMSLALGYWVHHGWFFFTAYARTDNPPQAFMMMLNQRSVSMQSDFNSPPDI